MPKLASGELKIPAVVQSATATLRQAAIRADCDPAYEVVATEASQRLCHGLLLGKHDLLRQPLVHHEIFLRDGNARQDIALELFVEGQSRPFHEIAHAAARELADACAARAVAAGTGQVDAGPFRGMQHRRLVISVEGPAGRLQDDGQRGHAADCTAGPAMLRSFPHRALSCPALT
jgi:hypothetical protein